MGPGTKLPPLTRAQDERVKAIRKLYKGWRVQVIRKGQKEGHVLVITHYRHVPEYKLYNPAGLLVAKWEQDLLFEMAPLPADAPGSALTDI